MKLATNANRLVREQRLACLGRAKAMRCTPTVTTLEYPFFTWIIKGIVDDSWKIHRATCVNENEKLGRM